MEERDELGVAAILSASSPSIVGDPEHERDDVAAVAAGVGVVRLDDVAEEERGAAIGLRELERGLDARLPLAGERAQKQRERQDEQEG